MARLVHFITMRWWRIVAVVTGVGLIIIGALLLLPKGSLPPSIKKQLTSALLVPKGPDVRLDRDSAGYDPSNKLLKFDVAYAGTTVMVTQQPSPEEFSDSPQSLDKTLKAVGASQTFDTAIGKVYLTMPTELKGQQTAILNAKGTMLFARPARELSNDEWRVFFTRVDLEK